MEFSNLDQKMLLFGISFLKLSMKTIFKNILGLLRRTNDQIWILWYL